MSGVSTKDGQIDAMELLAISHADLLLRALFRAERFRGQWRNMLLYLGVYEYESLKSSDIVILEDEGRQ